MAFPRERPDCPHGPDCAGSEACLPPVLCRLRALPGVGLTPRTLRRGETLAVGDGSLPGRIRLHVVRSGMAAASAHLRDGRRQILGLFVPGDIVCPFGLSDARCRAEALTATRSWEVSLPHSPTELAAHPVIAELCAEVTGRLLERALAHIVQLGRFDGAERISALLADLARRTGTRQDGGWELSLPLSREDIADHLGLNAETVSRLLSRLKRAGLVRFRTPTACTIPDLERLERGVPLRARPGGHAAEPDPALARAG